LWRKTGLAKATTRVHILARELGVKSKFIVQKCQAEGLDVKNHMSTISIGLAATIREWFSDGEHATAVETTKRVDLKKARLPRKRVKKTAQKTKPGPEPAEPAQTLAAVEAPAEPAKPAKLVKHKKVKPAEPKPIVPAGPMLVKPEPAKLSGPNVVRVEEIRPAELRPPKPRTPRKRYDMPISEPLMGAAKTETPAPSRGKKVSKEKTHGRRKDRGRTEEQASRAKVPGRRVRAKDFEERQARLAAARGESLRSRPSRKIETQKAAIPSHLLRPEKAMVAEPITVKSLSFAMAAKTGEIIAQLMKQGIMATANQTLATDVAELVALELGTELIVERKKLLQQLIEAQFEAREHKNLKKRPPVVTMLGHVDHGKTSLLDRIRSTSVANGEAGGITQHIGAYQVEWQGRKITFLDTPGHEAFTAMRARGANITDVVVLVVAADDGIMPQTVEAIHHAKAADVNIIVALNKIDLPGVDINRIYGQLAEHDLTPADWGGETEIVKTSAVTGEGIDDLIEHLGYIADLKEFKADSKVSATGWVIEAKMTTTEGVLATILLKEGVLKKADVILAGTGYGRVRMLKDSRGKSIKIATSSMPVEISGLSDVPQAGEKFFCLSDINQAKEAADQNRTRSREDSLVRRSVVTLDNLFSQIEAGNVKELNLIIRADVQGSVDVLVKYLTDLSTEDVKIRILHSAVGGITEGDAVLAQASNAIIIGFNVVADDRVRAIAESSGIDIRLYNVIYRITEDLRDAMTGLLDPAIEHREFGRLVVRKTFKISGVGTIAGCLVDTGLINKNAKLRLIRNNIVIKDNCSVASLKHLKDDAREVKAGFECGLRISGFDDIKVDDVFEAYEVVEVARKL